MSKINTIFQRVYRPLKTKEQNGEDFPQGTLRKQFIHDVTTHSDPTIRMSEKGSATYFYMCGKRFKQEDMYSSHKKYNNKVAEQKKAESVADQPTAEEQPQPEVNVDVSHRWLVGNNVEKQVFASFKTRSAAQNHNKELKSQGVESNWIDGNTVDKDEFTPVAVGQ